MTGIATTTTHLPARRRGAAATGGVRVLAQRVGGQAVNQAEVAQAMAALRQLPAADLALLASRGIQIQLFPTSGLEGGLLGATTIVQDAVGGSWRPTLIRVAARANLAGSEAIGEIVQHEVGHAVSVLRRQDRTEAGAIEYARRW